MASDSSGELVILGVRIISSSVRSLTTVVLRNNLSYAAPAGMWGATHSYNSWNLGVDEPRFVSTDPSSPDFLRLASGSPAIGAGTDVGLPYAGAAPDLGAIPSDSGYADILGGTLPNVVTTTAARP